MDISPYHIDNISSWPEEEQIRFFEEMSPEELLRYKYNWRLHARPNQILPENGWTTALYMGGRGAGKTRTGAEWIRECVEVYGYKRIGLVGATAADVRDVMCLGNSGIMTVTPPWVGVNVIGTKRVMKWDNGAEAHFYSAAEPERLRGPQHDAMWIDEFGAYGKNAEEIHFQARAGLRLNSSKGHSPKMLITTTPRKVERLKKLVDKYEEEGPEKSQIILITGGTKENIKNLSEGFVEMMEEEYGGTRLARQELDGELVWDVEGSLWTQEVLDRAKFSIPEGSTEFSFVDKMKRIVVGVDPSGGDGKKKSDEQGIIVAGVDYDGVYWVLADFSCSEGPNGWAKAVLNAYEAYMADKIIAEKNFGGELVRTNIQSVDEDANIKIIHASRSKSARAEPIANLYEQGKVRHIKSFEELEEQMSYMTSGGYDGIGSPDRVDALVWALTELKQSKKKSLKKRVKIRAH